MTPFKFCSDIFSNFEPSPTRLQSKVALVLCLRTNEKTFPNRNKLAVPSLTICLNFRPGITAAATAIMKALNDLSSSRITVSSLFICGVALATFTARADTITPSLDSVAGPIWTYNMDFSSGELQAGDGFTIVDFNGYVPGSIFAPLNWSVALNPPTAVGSPFGTPALSTVDTESVNLHFTYTGPTVEIASGPHLFVTGFGAVSTSPLYAIDDWISRDHLIGTIGVLGDGGVGSVHTDNIVVPAPVPEGRSTLTLLALGFMGLEGLRRNKLRVAQYE